MKKTGEETLTKINNLQLIQRNDFQNFTLDSVLLSDFITINRTIKNALDIGTGNGIISLLLANRSKANIVAIELYEIMAEIAKRNVINNKLEDRIDVIQADIRDYDKKFKKDNFDLIFCNPPYFEYDVNNAQVNELDQLAKARHEIDITIKEIISLNETNIAGQVMLYIKTKHKKGVIQRSMLENKAVYEQVKKLINDLIALQ